MKHLFGTFAGLVISVWAAHAQNVQWTAHVVHHDSSKVEIDDGWVISPASDSAGESRGFKETLEAIYAHGNAPHIKHVYLGTLFHRDDLQAEVVGYLKKQKSFHDSPPPFGTWAFKGSGEIQKLVSEALLQSQFVTALNNVLSRHKQTIGSVSMEKLYFTKEHDKIIWHAIVWLLVTPSANKVDAANPA